MSVCCKPKVSKKILRDLRDVAAIEAIRLARHRIDRCWGLGEVLASLFNSGFDEGVLAYRSYFDECSKNKGENE